MAKQLVAANLVGRVLNPRRGRDLPPLRSSLQVVGQPGGILTGITTECLTEIFLCARDRSSLGSRSTTVLRLCQVCRTWNNIILDQPALWTVIDMPFPEWITNFLARSKELPLRIYLPEIGLRCLDIVPLLTPHIHRVIMLVLQPEFEDKILLHLSLWSSAAPSLETLSLSHFDLPKEMFKRVKPMQLALDRCRICWSSTIFSSSLTYLAIWDPHVPISTHRLMSILSTLPALNWLILVHVVCTSTSQIIAGQAPILVPRVNLPSLDNIEIIENDSWVLEAILAGLDLSNVSFIIIETGSATDSFSRLLFTVLASADEFCIESLTIHADPESSWITLKSKSHPYMGITWDCRNCHKLVCSMFKVIPLYAIVTLNLDYIFPNSTSVWLKWQFALSGLPFLDTVVLANGAAIDFFSVFPLGHAKLNSVGHWIFRMEPDLFMGNTAPVRSRIKVAKLAGVPSEKLYRTVEFEGAWWNLEEYEVGTLEHAGWRVIVKP
ncbi:hypothetical protein BDN72DRAFT_861425 [Pluteus cervinus]|uniref:Uncharacterized protein n=1 Tax=Pluteus cervinus TaxID=181527 RepID=A0ACD3AFL7_9AGAR|nr:hypothetical protein BDN72DRAFT_861425 [Pluteus cervinus]